MPDTNSRWITIFMMVMFVAYMIYALVLSWDQAYDHATYRLLWAGAFYYMANRRMEEDNAAIASHKFQETISKLSGDLKDKMDADKERLSEDV